MFASEDDIYCHATEIAQPDIKILKQPNDMNNNDDADGAVIKIESRNSSESPTPPEAPRTGKLDLLFLVLCDLTIIIAFMCFSMQKEKQLRSIGITEVRNNNFFILLSNSIVIINFHIFTKKRKMI